MQFTKESQNYSRLLRGKWIRKSVTWTCKLTIFIPSWAFLSRKGWYEWNHNSADQAAKLCRERKGNRWRENEQISSLSHQYQRCL